VSDEGAGVVEPGAGGHGDLARIRGLGERGLDRAAASLGRMLGNPVRFTGQEIRSLRSSALPALADAVGGGAVALLRIEIRGEGSGWILILLPLSTVYRLLQALMGIPADPRDLTETERSAIQEVGNIVASSFLSELGDRLGRRFLPSAPEIHLDNVPRVLRGVLASVRELGTDVVVVHAVLEDRERRIQGRIFVVPAVSALEPASRDAAGGQGVST
jgi:chemotaxis protein CheC